MLGPVVGGVTGCCRGPLLAPFGGCCCDDEGGCADTTVGGAGAVTVGGSGGLAAGRLLPGMWMTPSPGAFSTPSGATAAGLPAPFQVCRPAPSTTAIDTEDSATRPAMGPQTRVPVRPACAMTVTSPLQAPWRPCRSLRYRVYPIGDGAY